MLCLPEMVKSLLVILLNVQGHFCPQIYMLFRVRILSHKGIWYLDADRTMPYQQKRFYRKIFYIFYYLDINLYIDCIIIIIRLSGSVHRNQYFGLINTFFKLLFKFNHVYFNIILSRLVISELNFWVRICWAGISPTFN